ncbi:hypothetical protein GUITHDRAFT_162236 [Guillardia theta CCMP2712]|uniref:PDZ domain-containing protein n=1 Tax=Guillardia theta (strain CCMP2712) TaxID=905079 RepID=L1JKL5_GUITC|nr:hypothetical protein GUITHDRAFT_162236 [Guillardia theta CCMP2712]EKX49073.1 hypothetical protein GUITHDRAFT_162236 [Guillardia theta CCMP2712]|eukprot:XP_005836053.1 hypothetical protein GUITHDRAFT_162236 [Guillardia theta CCMP2712]
MEKESVCLKDNLIQMPYDSTDNFEAPPLLNESSVAVYSSPMKTNAMVTYTNTNQAVSQVQSVQLHSSPSNQLLYPVQQVTGIVPIQSQNLQTIQTSAVQLSPVSIVREEAPMVRIPREEVTYMQPVHVQQEQRKIVIENEEPVFRRIPVQQDRIVNRHETLYVENVRVKDVDVEVQRINLREEPVAVEKIDVQEKQVPYDVPVENIIVKDEIKEVPVDRLNIQEISVPMQDVPVEKVVVQEIPVPIEKIIIRDVEVPVERTVERIIERQVDKVVNQERIVYQDNIIYKDRNVEVPVERLVCKGKEKIQQSFIQNVGFVMDSTGQLERNSGYMLSYSQPRRVLSNNAGVLFKTKKVGLGILLKRNSQGETYIHALLPGFAGAESGEVQVDDIIVTIDNQNVDNWDLDDIKQLTVGDEGSACNLVLRRRGQTHEQVKLIRIGSSRGQLESFEKSPGAT